MKNDFCCTKVLLYTAGGCGALGRELLLYLVAAGKRDSRPGCCPLPGPAISDLAAAQDR